MDAQRRKEIVLMVIDVIVETIRDMGARGAPSGPLYAALMSTGMSLEQYQQIMAGLVQKDIIREEGHVYFIVE